MRLPPTLGGPAGGRAPSSQGLRSLDLRARFKAATPRVQLGLTNLEPTRTGKSRRQGCMCGAPFSQMFLATSKESAVAARADVQKGLRNPQRTGRGSSRAQPCWAPALDVLGCPSALMNVNLCPVILLLVTSGEQGVGSEAFSSGPGWVSLQKLTGGCPQWEGQDCWKVERYTVASRVTWGQLTSQTCPTLNDMLA